MEACLKLLKGSNAKHKEKIIFYKTFFLIKMVLPKFGPNLKFIFRYFVRYKEEEEAKGYERSQFPKKFWPMLSQANVDT